MFLKEKVSKITLILIQQQMAEQHSCLRRTPSLEKVEQDTGSLK